MPIAMLLHTDGKHERPGGDATVTIAHRCTPKEQLKELTRLADIVIAATGVPNLITVDMVKPGAAVIDVGISRVQDQTGKVRLVGDVDFEEVKMKAGFITPVPGGVGPMTVAMKTHGEQQRDLRHPQTPYSNDSTVQSSLCPDQPTQNPPAISTGAGAMETPRILRLLGVCSTEHQGFCLNGHCTYHPDLNKPTCSCLQNFGGERCEHMILDSHAEGGLEKPIAISVGVALLLCCLIAALYCCMKKRCQKEKPYEICTSDTAI
ncbi:hypothetical protein AGOR_G00046470 [Albula goreensis]|uniref:EGF-like domain-containing protein n=1 Tax=Albula goreensis TaxID=1534307 RepID=A0A8T3DTD2_9TELE|nr:hypothetical protein AGOR_G00046470 [Albula goreensis]